MQALRRDIGWKARVALGAGIAAAALLLLLVSLGGDSSASAKGGATATASRSVTVNMEHLKFIPATIDISKGTKVVFFNNSRTKHTATRKGSFNTGVIKPGQSAAVKFTAAGTYAYRCLIHPEMRGKIVVG